MKIMSRLEIILSAMLLLAMTFNIIVFVYARGVVSNLLSVSEELGDLQTMVDAFAKHAKTVYELEMFYGDPILQNLMDHAVSFNEQLETFEYIYSLTEQPQIETEDEEVDYEKDEA
tara:strand:+ start:1015 stop:1362 length:348 start_codon:yes stop_codon:yes gene_type:complete